MQVEITEKQMRYLLLLTNRDQQLNKTPRSRQLMKFLGGLLNNKTYNFETTVNEARYFLKLLEAEQNKDEYHIIFEQYWLKQFRKQHPKADINRSKHTGYAQKYIDRYDSANLKPREAPTRFNGVCID